MLAFIAVLTMLTVCVSSGFGAEVKKLVARTFDSGFELAHQTYNGISAASDGRIYYVLCSESIDTGAQMYSYDPVADKIKHVGDLTEASGEKGTKAIVQGKSHVPFFESNGKLYFATHVGYYTVKGGRELMGVPPHGYKPYPGGHFLAYDLATGKFEDLAKGPEDQGILTMTMDSKRGRLYGITWPNGYFLRYDLASRNLKNLGPISEEGEAGTGPSYRTLCRSMVVNPEDGSVYFTTSEGTIHRYRYDRDAIEQVREDNLRKDYFGTYDHTSPGHMGYNWRQAVWYAPESGRLLVAFLGVAMPPVLLLGVAVNLLLARSFEASTRERLDQSLRAVKGEIDRRRARAREALQQVVSVDLPAMEARTIRDAAIAGEVAAARDLAALEIVGERRPVVSSHHWPAGFGLADRDGLVRGRRVAARRDGRGRLRRRASSLALDAAGAGRLARPPRGRARRARCWTRPSARSCRKLAGVRGRPPRRTARGRWIAPPGSGLLEWSAPAFGVDPDCVSGRGAAS